MKIIIFISMIIVLSASIIDTTTPCTCTQLSQNDCQKNSGCTWNKTCQTKQITTSLTPTYCSQYTDDKCNQDQVCMWIKGNCIQFTGCSAYALTTDTECNQISKLCYKSDQTKCIQLGQCEDYLKESVCIQNIDNHFCYWDSVTSTCKLADQCSNQPIYADTDKKCRSQLSSCTTIPGGGCKEASDNCSDVKLEIQCYYNKYMTQECFWDSSVNPPVCKEKNCNNAPTSYTMDKQCSSFISTCTTKLNGGCTLRAGCEVAQVKAACITDSNGQECFWVDGSCKQKLCNNATKMIVTNIGCQSINPQCITKSGGGCKQNGECKEANVDYACKTNIRGEQCFWDVISNTCKDRTCINAPISYTTNEQCTKYLQSCTINTKKAGCEDRSCANAPISIQTIQGCQDFFNDTCITKKGGGCITKKQCTDIDIEISCLIDKEGTDCYWNNDKCQLKICENIPKTTINSETQVEEKITLTHNLCQQFMNTCTINQAGDNCIDYICSNVTEENACINNQSCIWRQNCFLQSCYTAPLSYNTHTQCSNYLSGCTISQSGQGCAIMMKTCNQYKLDIQCIQSIASQCEWQNQQCVQRTCLTADEIYTTTALCASYLSGCVVNNKKTGCMATITKCSDSLVSDNCTLSMCYWSNDTCNTRQCGSQTHDCANIHAPTKCINNEGKTQCIAVPSKCQDLPTEYCKPTLSFDLINKYCYINTTCVDFTLQSTCSSYTVDQCIIRSNNQGKCVWYNTVCYNSVCSALPNDLNTTNKCKGVISTCIVDNDSAGCREIGECSSYSSSNCDQLDSNGKVCAMKDGTCQIKSCATASVTNHTDCFNYILSGTRCTVNSTSNGCIALQSCTSYTVNTQCIINQNQLPCYWNTTTNKCIDKTCDLETTSTTHDQCQSFMNTCTLNTTNQGCMTLPTCSLITDQIICNSNTKCVFVNGNCVIKTCSNAILDPFSVSSCTALPFPNCYYDSQFCTTKTCNYYIYQTDDQCKAQNPVCTSDGIQCVERLQCNDAKAEQGCVTDILGNLCQWISGSNSCSLRSCSTAPNTYQSEAQCKDYYPGCTTKSGGGCAVKSTCAAATAQQACTTSVSGEICHWDESISMCRNQSCIDFIGTTYQACQKFGKTCTTDGISKCTDISTCEQYGNALSCIVGIDGPCLWINQKCYQYNGCTSIKLKTHNDCQSINTKCTTDGNQCVPITECRLTNLNGCVLGIEGSCFVLTTTDTNTKKCALFSSCSDITYTTHEDCNKANKQCTTDTIHCISLLTCKDYKLEQQCYLDSQGVQYINNQVKSTGLCKWESSACRAQICEDLIGVTHTICNTQMYTCTSDGKQCITMAKCQSYNTQNQCTNAIGTDGICYYTKENICRLKACTDILTDCTQLSICVSDGTKCVSKNKCSAYETQTACSNAGTDGICIWNTAKSSCVLFSSCSIADNQANCNKMPTLCYWSTDSKCIDLTCAQQYKQTSTCTYINTWTTKQINTCALNNGVCSESDPTQLSINDCYKLTGYTYTFSSTLSKCLKCGSTNDTNTTTNNTNNESNETQTNSCLLILRMIIVIILIVL